MSIEQLLTLLFNVKKKGITTGLRATIKPEDFPVMRLQCSARHQEKTRCLKQRGRLSGKAWQKATVISERRCCTACLCQQKRFKYTPMNMQFLYEEFDNKGPNISFLMRLDCLCLNVCICMYVCAHIRRLPPYCPTYCHTMKLGKGDNPQLDKLSEAIQYIIFL